MVLSELQPHPSLTHSSVSPAVPSHPLPVLGDSLMGYTHW